MGGPARGAGAPGACATATSASALSSAAAPPSSFPFAASGNPSAAKIDSYASDASGFTRIGPTHFFAARACTPIVAGGSGTSSLST